MLVNYFKIALRNLARSRFYSFINIGGLAVGMAVAMLIGLWIYDELIFNKSFKNYDRVGQLWQFVKFDAEKSSYDVLPIPLAEELRSKYPDFKSVSLSKQSSVTFIAGDKKLLKSGNFVEPGFTEIMSLKMLAGNRNDLKDMNSIFLSESLAKSMFGKEEPMNKLVTINNKKSVKVTGVYADFPANTTFNDVQFLASWDWYVNDQAWVKNSKYEWDSNSWQIYAQLKEGVDFGKVSAKIKDIRMKKEDPPSYKPEFFVHPMRKWHLFSDFKNGVNTGGLIQFVWLFGIIGVFVLLLACINFMNLSTARSEKRAREVGIRKAIGSVRRQLIIQFLSESILVALFAFALSLGLVQLTLPFFNDITGKEMTLLLLNPVFWLWGLGFTILTGLIAGSYPALYLSSFKPIKVLKGTLKAGRFAAIPRKALVVVQFTVSASLIIGTIVVFRQIQFAKNRPVGYNRGGLIEMSRVAPELFSPFDALRNDLLNTGMVSEVSASSGSVTVQYGGTTAVSWRGKARDIHPLLMSNNITHEFGKTIGWQLIRGRDFSRDFTTDSAAVILNESAAKLMGFSNPLDEIFKYNGKTFKVIGVTADMIRESPFDPVKPTFYILNYKGLSVINVKLSPTASAGTAIAAVERVFKKHDPAGVFDYNFADEQYGKKFAYEVRIGKLALFFATLAIFISCLGLFGLASFIAEQRTKEIGIRKVIGASVLDLWGLLSKEFIVLVVFSFLIAAPIAYYFMNNWLQNYAYRAGLSWWIFGATGMGVLLITLLTVSFQAIRAAMANPVKSLRTE